MHSSSRLTSALLFSLLAGSISACGACGGSNATSPTAEVPTQAAPQAPITISPERPIAPPAASFDPTSETALGTAMNDFGLKLMQALPEGSGNFAMSPASIWIALAMTADGARAETAAQMRAVLGNVDGGHAGELARSWQTSENVELAIANRLFGQQGYAFQQAYIDGVSQRFDAALEPVDFMGATEPTRLRINGWVEEKTRERIQDLIPAGVLNGDTRLVLVNAIYFLSTWQTAFAPESTTTQTFHVDAGRTMRVPMMSATSRFAVGEMPNADVIALPYANTRYEMLVMLPNEGTSLASFSSSLTNAAITTATQSLGMRRVALSLPRFRVEQAAPTRLNEPLKALGMPLAFDRDRADFTGMANPRNPDEQLHIAHVLHKAFVQVDERGTEAAAATAVVMATRSGAMPTETRDFRVDRPFFFAVRDTQSGAILFMGRVETPEQAR